MAVEVLSLETGQGDTSRSTRQVCCSFFRITVSSSTPVTLLPPQSVSYGASCAWDFRRSGNFDRVLFMISDKNRSGCRID